MIESSSPWAQFNPYGASITNLSVKDISGVERDIMLGYDNAYYYKLIRFTPITAERSGVCKNSSFVIDAVT
jgi:aldose 1-epimerase